MFPAVQHSSSKSLLALLWGISSIGLFEPYRGAFPARLLLKYFCGGSSPSRVFTEDVSVPLSSRAVFSSPRRMVLFPDIPVSSRSRLLSGVFGLPYGRRVVPGGWSLNVCLHVCLSAFIIHSSCIMHTCIIIAFGYSWCSCCRVSVDGCLLLFVDTDLSSRSSLADMGVSDLSM